MTPSLADLHAGYQFEPIRFDVSSEAVRAYREATGDVLGVYAREGPAVPPLAVAALALGAMLRRVSLPAGSLHASESLECRAVVPEGSEVVCMARLAQRSVRAGWVVSVLETDLIVSGETALLARATVLSPAAEA